MFWRVIILSLKIHCSLCPRLGEISVTTNLIKTVGLLHCNRGGGGEITDFGVSAIAMPPAINSPFQIRPAKQCFRRGAHSNELQFAEILASVKSIYKNAHLYCHGDRDVHFYNSEIFLIGFAAPGIEWRTQSLTVQCIIHPSIYNVFCKKNVIAFCFVRFHFIMSVISHHDEMSRIASWKAITLFIEKSMVASVLAPCWCALDE